MLYVWWQVQRGDGQNRGMLGWDHLHLVGPRSPRDTIYPCRESRVATEAQEAARRADEGAEAAAADAHEALRGAMEAGGPAPSAAGPSAGPLGFSELTDLAASRMAVWRQNNPGCSDVQARCSMQFSCCFVCGQSTCRQLGGCLTHNHPAEALPTGLCAGQ